MGDDDELTIAGILVRNHPSVSIRFLYEKKDIDICLQSINNCFRDSDWSEMDQ